MEKRLFRAVWVLISIMVKDSRGFSNTTTTASPLDPLFGLPAAIVFDHGSIDTSGLDTIPLLIDTRPAPTHASITPHTGRNGALLGEYSQNPYTVISLGPSLSSQCSLQYSSAFADYIATGSITTEVFTQSNLSSSLVIYEHVYRFSATSPCCLACQLKANNAQVLFWPTPGPTPAVTALVDPTGFTYVSPSVYVVFDELAATNLCGQAGLSFQNRTISFGPSELSTTQFLTGPRGYQLYFSQYDWTAFNYADLTNTNCTAEPVAPLLGPLSAVSLTHNPCFPLLSVPSEIYALDGAWSTCINALNVVYDPPRTLTTGDFLTAEDPSTTPVAALPQTSNTAKAGPTIPAQTPDPTAVTVADPHTADVNPPASPKLPAPGPPVAAPHDTIIPASKTADLDPGSKLGSPTVVSKLPIEPTFLPDGSGQSAAQKPPILASLSINGNPIAAPPLIIGSQVLAPGSTILIAGTPVALGAQDGSLVIASQTLSPGSTISLAGTPIALGAQNGALVIGSQTLSPGSIISIAGTPVAHGGQNVVTGGQNVGPVTSIQTLARGSIISVAGTPVAVGSQDGTVVIGGQTLHPGSIVSLAGTPIAHGTQDGVLLVGSQTLFPGSTISIAGTPVALAAPIGVPVTDIQTLSPGSTVSVAGTPIAIGPQGSLIVGTHTLAAGSTIAIAGTSIALGDHGNIIVGTQTYASGSTATIAGTPIAVGVQNGGHAKDILTLSPGSTILVAGTPIALLAQGDLVVGSQTLPPGSTTSIAGTPVAGGAHGDIIIGTRTYTPGSRITIAGTPIAFGVQNEGVVIGSQTLFHGSTIFISGTPIALAAQNDALVIGSQTLLPGSTILVAGTPIALGAQNGDFIVGSSTEAIGLGGLIMSGFQADPTPTPTPTVIAGISLSIDASEAVISGTIYEIDSNRSPTTVVVGSATLSIGPQGVAIASPSLSIITIGNLKVSIDPTEAVIGGTTYQIGNGARPTTAVIGNETLTFGSGGIGFHNKTVSPPPITASGGSEGTLFTGDATGSRGMMGLIYSVITMTVVFSLILLL